ncbi:branched-chain-amino-acid aminotransferase, mitochondrial [Aspergillus lentulus]|nr:branched-chain-amino-acid aminotransferase, mitochondrial [Aspergillus lentulus]
MAPEDFLPPSVFRLTDNKPFPPQRAQLDASRTRVSLTKSPKPVPPANAPELSSHNIFTDHMVCARWTASPGWDVPAILPHGPLTIPPSASALHYATACFEGMKAYRGHDGKLRLFRPQYNAARMLASAARVSLPSFDPAQLLHLIRQLCALDAPRWLPAESAAGSSLYIRPTLVGTDDSLGFQVPREALLYIIISYWPSPAAAGPGLSLWASDGDTVRAWPGGSGSAKLAANYGPSILAHSHARRKGCDQVLWLFGSDGWVTEAGSMNVFVIWRTRQGQLQVVTPGLDEHTILAGVTRHSVLDLVRERLSGVEAASAHGIEPVEVVECIFTIHDIVTAAREGRLVGLFAVGTAASVVPVREIQFKEETILVESSQSPYVSLLQGWMADITSGREQSMWTEVVDEHPFHPGRLE